MNKSLIAAIGVLILAAGSGSAQADDSPAIRRATRQAPANADSVEDGETRTNQSKPASTTTKAPTFKSPSEQEAKALVKKALAVRNPDEVAAVIRPGTMTPEEVVDALQAIRKEFGEITSTVWLSSIDKNGMSLDGVEVTYGTDKKVKRLAFLTPDASGIWKLDFPAFVRQVKPSWEKLLDGTAAAGVVRVNVAQDRYYNGPFQDEAVWAAYGMVSPDMDELLVGYCKRDSKLHRIMELMWNGVDTQAIRATLEIRRVEGGARRQFQITRVLAEDWVMGDKPFDETVEGPGNAPVIPPTTRKRMSNEELD